MRLEVELELIPSLTINNTNLEKAHKTSKEN